MSRINSQPLGQEPDGRNRCSLRVRASHADRTFEAVAEGEACSRYRTAHAGERMKPGPFTDARGPVDTLESPCPARSN
jgi:hypothetical protein